MDITDVVKAAGEKFGEVITVTHKGDNEYFVACKRAQAPLPERPYMTITAATPRSHEPQRVAFFWGHYDLTLEEVLTAITQEAHAALSKARHQ